MAESWYSAKPQRRFSREHREQLPAGARMIDLDGVVYAPYVKGSYGGPLLLVEFKPQNAKEDYWQVTRQLARMAGIPAARVIEQVDGLYTIHLAAAPDYEPKEIGRGMTMTDWFRMVEKPLREQAGHKFVTPEAA